jgi:hypothetical protein
LVLLGLRYRPLNIERWGSATSANYIMCVLILGVKLQNRSGLLKKQDRVKCRKTGPGPVIAQEMLFCVGDETLKRARRSIFFTPARIGASSTSAKKNV